LEDRVSEEETVSELKMLKKNGLLKQNLVDLFLIFIGRRIVLKYTWNSCS